jgi:CHAT domain-containing protein
LQEARFRSGYVEEKFEVYLELMRLQLQLGRSSDAFSTAERLRARSFVEQLGGRAAVPLSVDERRTETELRERVRALQRSLDETNDDGAAAYPERAMNRFSEELLQAEKSYQTFLDDHTHFRSAGGDHGADVAAVQRRLEPGEALLEYVVGPNAVVAFVLTSRGLNVKYTPLQENELAARISLLRDLVRHPGDARWQKPATRLSATLIEPLERAGWLDGLKRLYIVPHGALSALPFNLLPLAAGRDELLVDRYTIAYLPSAAALLRELPATAIAPTLLAVAPARGGLRHASEEARAIDALFRPNARALVGSEATEGRFKQLAGGFRMLHLATHGYFNDFSPLLSGLELEPDRANDGMLRVHEILDLPLQARLVTLSACDTALASGYFAASPAGDGFIGISRAFLAAGSASVMATLWQVDDRASVALMKQFYTRLNTAGAGGSAAAALASTQRAMRHSAQLAHPYYWAAYVVLGRMEPDVRVAVAPKGRTS